MSKTIGIRPWIIWSLGALGFFYAFFQRVSASAMIDDLMRDFAVNAALLGNLSAAYFYAYMFLQVPVGVMADRWGPRRLMAIAAFLCAIGGAMFASAETLSVAYMGRLLTGAGSAFFFVCALKLLSVWFPPQRFAYVSGLVMFVGVSGGIVGQAPLAAAVDIFGWRPAIMATAMVGIIYGIVCWFVVVDHPDHITKPTTNRSATPTTPILTGLGLALKHKQTWVLALLGASMSSTLLAFGALWGVPYMMTVYGLERPQAAGSVSLLLLGWAFAAPTIGWISDRIQRRKMPALVCSVGALVSFTLLIYGPTMPLYVANGLILVNGAMSAGMVVGFATVREHNRAEAAGSAVSFVNMCVVVSGAFLQPLIGWILDLHWDGAIESGARVFEPIAYSNAFLTLIGTSVCSVIAASLIRETYCRPSGS